MPWFSSGRITNPALEAVILDTGPLTEGSHSLAVAVASTASGAVELQLRNAANDTTVQSQIIGVATNGFAVLPTLDTTVEDGGRMRVTAVGAILGVVSVSLWTQL
jgi:Trk K+ transport system NAD-binding subunit